LLMARNTRRASPSKNSFPQPEEATNREAKMAAKALPINASVELKPISE
jgi:hypothetical protein